MTTKQQKQYSLAQTPHSQPHTPHLQHAVSPCLPIPALQNVEKAWAVPSPPQLHTGPGRSPPLPLCQLPHSSCGSAVQCPHATGCHPEAASQGAKNTCCSLQTLDSCSWDSGRPGECWGWASLRSEALLCLLTPSWVCLWPGSAADAACRSAQAGRDGLPAAGTAARGQGASPQQWLCAPLTLAQPPLRGRWENGEGAQGGVARRSTEEFAGSPRSRQIKALGRAPGAGQADGGRAACIAGPLGVPLSKKRLFPSLQRKLGTGTSQATTAGTADAW